METDGEARLIVSTNPNMETNPIGARFIESDVRRDVSCPYCRSTDTEFLALFGQQLLTEQYYCNNCHTPFEYVKDDEGELRADAGL